jgi:hypothetical protein
MKLAPEKPQGTPIYFSDDIPIVWLFERLADAGLITTRWISDGQMHSVLSAEARARVVGQINDARMRAVQANGSTER